LPTGHGRESQDRRFQGGTIYNDAASGLIWVENQVSLGANETVMGKARFEQWLWDQCVSEVKHYHGDNGIFSAEEYRRDCNEKGQSQSFSGVGAQHQNARAERAIQTTCTWHGPLWFMPLCIGQNVDLTISLSGLSQ
jgi:transposase InsO family protein